MGNKLVRPVVSFQVSSACVGPKGKVGDWFRMRAPVECSGDRRFAGRQEERDFSVDFGFSCFIEVMKLGD